MGVDETSERRLLLFYCSFTCIYLPGILALVKFNDNLCDIGTYKFIPILAILMFAEVVKLCLSPRRAISSRSDGGAVFESRRTPNSAPKQTLKFVLTNVAAAVFYYVAVVLFGAPLLSDHEGTTVLIVTLTALTFFPASLHLGVDRALLLSTGASARNDDVLSNAVSTNTRATLLGAWLGAFVIPLDWDRPWQVWPVPCVTGALVGYTVAHFFTLFRTLPYPSQYDLYKSRSMRYDSAPYRSLRVR